MQTDLVGKRHIFPDGVLLEIVQVKERDDGPWVTYHTTYSNGIPKKLVMKQTEFISMYGHLFGLKDAPPKRP